MDSKFCPYCKQDKPLSEWSTSKNIHYCKVCWRNRSTTFRKMHRSRHLEISKKCWSKNKDKYNLDRKPGGRTVYETLFFEQSGLCAICNRPETSQRYKTLTVDHCHKTEAIRGLLCSNCNRALGMFRDSLTILESAIKYLKRYE